MYIAIHICVDVLGLTTYNIIATDDCEIKVDKTRNVNKSVYPKSLTCSKRITIMI